jgi:hypothetical protein
VIATPDRRLRVFVSSTLEELAPERAAARVAIENLRLTPVLFELGASEAKRLLGEALRRVVALDAKLGVSVYVDLLSDLAANTREDGLATRLAGAAEASFAALGVPISPVVGDRDARLLGLRDRLGEAFEAEYEEGKSLTLDAAVEQALGWAERG